MLYMLWHVVIACSTQTDRHTELESSCKYVTKIVVLFLYLVFHEDPLFIHWGTSAALENFNMFCFVFKQIKSLSLLCNDAKEEKYWSQKLKLM